MKKIIAILISILSVTSYAELIIDNSPNANEVLSKFRFNEDYQNAEWPFGDDNSPSVKELRERWYWDGNMSILYLAKAQFPLLFNGKEYYSAVADFENSKSNSIHNRDLQFLLLYNKDRTVAAYSSILVKKNKKTDDNPRPIVLAFSLASVIKNSILLTVEYEDKNYLKSGDYRTSKTHASTLLFRLSETNGKLKLEQDDSCLGNPNNYKTISEARAALKISSCN